MAKPLLFRNFAMTANSMVGDPVCNKYGNKGLGFIICDSHKLSQKNNFFSQSENSSHAHKVSKRRTNEHRVPSIIKINRNQTERRTAGPGLPGKLK